MKLTQNFIGIDKIINRKIATFKKIKIKFHPLLVGSTNGIPPFTLANPTEWRDYYECRRENCHTEIYIFEIGKSNALKRIMANWYA